MPNLTWSQALTANQQGFDPLSSWQYRIVPYPAIVTCYDRATTTGVRLSAFSGTTNVQQRSPVQGGGTAGVTPSAFTTPALQFVAQAGDLLSLVHDEVAGGAPTVDGVITIDPL